MIEKSVPKLKMAMIPQYSKSIANIEFAITHQKPVAQGVATLPVLSIILRGETDFYAFHND